MTRHRRRAPQGRDADRAFPAVRVEAPGRLRAGLTTRAMPLRIVVDVRRVRDFGIGTYIHGLLHALAAIDQSTSTSW